MARQRLYWAHTFWLRLTSFDSKFDKALTSRKWSDALSMYRRITLCAPLGSPERAKGPTIVIN